MATVPNKQFAYTGALLKQADAKKNLESFDGRAPSGSEKKSTKKKAATPNEGCDRLDLECVLKQRRTNHRNTG